MMPSSLLSFPSATGSSLKTRQVIVILTVGLLAVCGSLKRFVWFRRGGGASDSVTTLKSAAGGSKSKGQSIIPAPLDVSDLAIALEKARTDLEEDLKVQYGRQNFVNMFYHHGGPNSKTKVSRGRLFLTHPTNPHLMEPSSSSSTTFSEKEITTDNSPGWNLLVSKLARKILQGHRLKQQQTAENNVRKKKNKKSSSSEEEAPPTFVWATGCHSSAAGHGNFMHEAYTAVLERQLAPILHGIFSINVEGRNYGMSATASAPEMALCSGAVYGHDNVDVLAWDAGLTDAAAYWKMVLYFWRAAFSTTNRAVMVALNVGDPVVNGAFNSKTKAAKRIEQLAALQDTHQLPVLVQNDQVWNDAIAAIPDCQGLTGDQLQAMPAAVQNFKCAGVVEKGEPYCKQEKFNRTMCVKRKYQTSWHPGYKVHALQGNLMALGVLDALQDALDLIDVMQEEQKQQMQQANNNKNQTLRVAPVMSVEQQLATAEQQLFDETIRAASLPALPAIAADWGLPAELNITTIWRDPALCRTARMPSQTRLLGISGTAPAEAVANASDKKYYGIMGDYIYYKGLPRFQAKVEVNNEMLTEMRLVQDMARQDKYLTGCNQTWRWDFQDAYLLQQTENWGYITIPNDMEQQTYWPNSDYEPKGILAICMTTCMTYEKCSKQQALAEDFFVTPHGSNNTVAEMQVNGISVTAMTRLDSCHFLKHADGYIWPPNADGQFQIQARVLTTGWHMLLSSVIVW